MGGNAAQAVADRQTEQREDCARREHAKGRQEKPAERRHVGSAERGVFRQHVHDAESDADEPFPAAAEIVFADQQGDEQCGNRKQHPQEHDPVAHRVRAAGEEPEHDQRKRPDAEV